MTEYIHNNCHCNVDFGLYEIAWPFGIKRKRFKVDKDQAHGVATSPGMPRSDVDLGGQSIDCMTV